MLIILKLQSNLIFVKVESIQAKHLWVADTAVIYETYTLQQILLPALQFYVLEKKKITGGRGLILLKNCLQPQEKPQIKERP